MKYTIVVTETIKKTNEYVVETDMSEAELDVIITKAEKRNEFLNHFKETLIFNNKPIKIIEECEGCENGELEIEEFGKK